MSRVTNVMISVHVFDQDSEAFKEVLGKNFARNDECDEAWGGTKFPECNIAAAALNYADVDALLDWIGGLAWNEPTSVQVFIMGEDDDKWQVHTIPCPHPRTRDIIRDGDPRRLASICTKCGSEVVTV